ncbi:hypothetical protein A2U01_0055786, partial [Trifolium medium]|nr:hypothetical protein [Trifolium medium]
DSRYSPERDRVFRRSRAPSLRVRSVSAQKHYGGVHLDHALQGRRQIDCRNQVSLSAHQNTGFCNDSRRRGSYYDQEQYVVERSVQGQFAVERRNKVGAELRRQSRVGRSRVRRPVQNANSGCVGGK